MKKKLLKAAEMLRGVRGLDDDERLLFAWSLTATPRERWERHKRFLRSLGLSTRSGRKRSGFNS